MPEPRRALWRGKLPREVFLKAGEIKPAGIAVYAALAQFANRRGEAWPALTTLAAMLHLQRDTVQEAVRRLVQHDLVVRHEKPGRSILFVLPHLAVVGPWAKTTLGENHPGSENGDTLGEKRPDTLGEKRPPNQDPENPSREHTPPAASASTSHTPEDLLEVWTQIGTKLIRPTRLTPGERKDAAVLLDLEPWERIVDAIGRANEAAFCTGAGRGGWKMELGFFLQPGIVDRIRAGAFGCAPVAVTAPARRAKPASPVDVDVAEIDQALVDRWLARCGSARARKIA